MGFRRAVVLLLAAAACGHDEATPAKDPPKEDGGARACVAGELTREDGSCVPAGVTACGEGFVGDGAGGCNAVLPSSSCERGLLAVPGDASCRPVAPCPDDPYGDAPVEPSTLFVDAAYTGGMSDGSRAHPFTAIQPAVDAANAGAVVAVAAGSYAADLRIRKSVRLWGRCTSLVEIRGAASSLVYVSAADVEIHALAVTGAGHGVGVGGAKRLLLDRIWVHDTSVVGVLADFDSEVTLRDSLVEHASEIGVFSRGAVTTVDRSVVRDTALTAANDFGQGINAQVQDASGRRSTLHVRLSVVERNHEFGIFVGASDGVIESSVIRGTLPRTSDGLLGRGVGVQSHPTKPDMRGKLELRTSLVERNVEAGVSLGGGADAVVENTVIRDTQPQAHDQRFGMGLYAGNDPNVRNGPTVTVRMSLLERNMQEGVFLFGADGVFEGTIVRDTSPIPVDGSFGRGIEVAESNTPGGVSSAVVRGCVIRGSRDAGIIALGSTVEVEQTLVTGTMPDQNGSFGDAIVVARDRSPASARVRRSRLESNARAGLAVFGATASVGESSMMCNKVALDGEAFDDETFDLADDGGNQCGCAESSAPCVASSSQLTPPKRPTTPGQ